MNEWVLVLILVVVFNGIGFLLVGGYRRIRWKVIMWQGKRWNRRFFQQELLIWYLATVASKDFEIFLRATRFLYLDKYLYKEPFLEDLYQHQDPDILVGAEKVSAG